MTSSKRRRLLAGLGTALAAGALPFSARALIGPNDKFDLVIKGGEVLDPSKGLRARRDVGIRFGIVESLDAEIPAARALRVIDARGRLVVPGLIDLHSHVFPYGSAIGIPADELVQHQGTTTTVSAGDAGANNIAIFRRHIVAQTRTRLYAFVHIANIGLTGFPIPELYNIDYAIPEAAAKAIAENADIVIGCKVRMSQNVIARNGLEPLKRAVRACEMSGVPARVMCHIGGVETVALMSQILDTLRAGDILTHCFSGAPKDAGQFTNIVQDGKVLPAAIEAKKRGVLFDIGHGGGSFDYTVAEAAIKQGVLPDSISSDIHVFWGNSPGMPYLTWVMSKFLNMGFTLEQVIAMSRTERRCQIRIAQRAESDTVLSVTRLSLRRSPLRNRRPVARRLLCHCAMCHKTHGHVGAYTAAPRSALHITTSRGLQWYRSSPVAERGFCRECGGTLFWQGDGRDMVSIAAGSLNAPTGLKTVLQVYVSHAGTTTTSTTPFRLAD